MIGDNGVYAQRINKKHIINTNETRLKPQEFILVPSVGDVNMTDVT